MQGMMQEMDVLGNAVEKAIVQRVYCIVGGTV